MVNLFIILCLMQTYQVKEIDDHGLEIIFSIEDVKAQTNDLDFPGACYLSPEGAPDVPSLQFLVGIPQGSDVQVSVTGHRYQTKHDKTIDPVKYPLLDEGTNDALIGERDPVYAKNELYPNELVVVSESGWFRDINTVTLTINPVQYNPVMRETRISLYVKVMITFTKNPVKRAVADRLFEKIYQYTLVNYEQCKNWRRAPEPSMRLSQFGSGAWYKIEVAEEGVYRIGQDEVIAAGIDPAQFEPRTMKIYTADFDVLPLDPTTSTGDTMIEVPVYVTGESDGSFDKGDHLYFYAYTASHSVFDDTLGWYENGYTRSNVYWFTFGGDPGRRMTEVDAAWGGSPSDTTVTEFIHTETDIGNPTRSGTNWYWLDISPNEGNLGSGEIMLYHPYALGDASIKTSVYPLNSGDWLYRFSLDGSIFYEETLSLSARVEYPPHYVIGNTTITDDSSRMLIETIRVAGSPSSKIEYMNAVDVEYTRYTSMASEFHAYFDTAQTFSIKCFNAGNTPLILDITDVRNPQRLIGYQVDGSTIQLSSSCDSFQVLYFSHHAIAASAVLVGEDPGKLRVAGSGCEYLVITHPKFLYAIQALVDYRQQDYSVKVVDIYDIYNDFSYGKYDPLAIKHFLYYTLNNWTTYPTFVLLVGDATYDFRNNLAKTDPPNYVPLYESGTRLSGNPGMPPNRIYEGEYVAFSGGASIVLARIPVRTQQEVRDYVEKLITYETKNTDGIWNKRIILASDDEWSSSYKWEWSDPGGRHAQYCERLITHVPDSLYDFAKVYMISYPPFVYPCEKLNAQQAFIKELNKGAFAGLYYGHGNTHQLADEGLFFDKNIPQVKNGWRNFFYYFGSCTVSRFNDSDYECIGEQLVRMKEGAIGTMGETGPCGGMGNAAIGDTLFALLTRTDMTMGECFNAVPGRGEYLLLGDPATHMKRPDPDTFVNLLVSPDSVRPLEQVSVMPPGERYYLKAFVRDTTTIEKFDEATIDRISERISRLIQINDVPNYLQFTYYIYGKEVYYGFWDDTAQFFTPQAVTTNLPVMRFSTYYGMISGLKDSVRVYGAASPSTDVTGPEIIFYDGARRLNDNDWVTQEFILTGKVSDESGINMLNSVYDPRGFYLYINQNSEEKADLRDLFIYDQNSFTSGEFNITLNLPEQVDTIHLNVTDNYFNQTNTMLILNAELYGGVDIENFLIYPNPVTQNSEIWFTFSLSNAATATIKVFTISGRLIKTIDNVVCSAGYNQIAWNGRDEYEDDISNGVYLVKAYVQGTSGHDEIIEKFIIAR